MGEIIFKTELIKGAKGDRGEAGQADSIPTDGVIAFQGETVPDGYEETDPGDVFDEVYEDINAVKDMIADEYDTTATYNAGDFCIHENALYKCTATTTGLWDSSKWVLTSAGDEIKTNTAAIESKQSKILDTPLTIQNVVQTTVENALGGLKTFSDKLKFGYVSTPSITVPSNDCYLLFICKAQYGQSSIWVIDTNGAFALVNPSGDTVTYTDNGDNTVTISWNVAIFSYYVLISVG